MISAFYDIHNQLAFCKIGSCAFTVPYPLFVKYGTSIPNSEMNYIYEYNNG